MFCDGIGLWYSIKRLEVDCYILFDDGNCSTCFDVTTLFSAGPYIMTRVCVGMEQHTVILLL